MNEKVEFEMSACYLRDTGREQNVHKAFRRRPDLKLHEYNLLFWES